MRGGVAFDESDYEDTTSESYRGFRILGWLPRLETDPSPADYIAGMSPEGPHGGPFEYRSIFTDVLGWCLERATGEPLASLFSSRIWEPMGAANDADLLLGPGGFPLADGGFCVTLSDLARFGLMYLQGGEIDGRQVVPVEWVHRLRVTDHDLIAAFRSSPDSRDMPPTAFYHDQWWIYDAEAVSTRDTASTGSRCSSTILQDAWSRGCRAGPAPGRRRRAPGRRGGVRRVRRAGLTPPIWTVRM